MALISRYRTVFSGVAGAPWYSNMFFEGGTPEGEAYGEDVQNFWTGVASQMITAVTWEIEPTYTVFEASTGLITDVGGWAGDAGAGLVSGEGLPYAVQAIVNWHTSVYVAGRELRGRTFIPGLTVTANDQGTLLESAQADIQTAASGLISGSSGAMTIFSRTHLVEHIVETAQVPLKLGVLRSRRD